METTRSLDDAMAVVSAAAASEQQAAAIFYRVLEFAVVPMRDSMTWGDRLLTLDKSAEFRLNTLIWGARRGLTLKGDFVECGVYKGDMSWVVTEMVDLATAGRTFYLYDTFDGFAQEYSSPADFPGHPGFFDVADTIYRASGLHEAAVERFAGKPYVKVVKGAVPDTLRAAAPDRIAFLHVDMNSPGPETAALELLFDRVSPGAAIIYDDYGWNLFRKQKEAADAFMAAHDHAILELPTGQGLTIKR